MRLDFTPEYCLQLKNICEIHFHVILIMISTTWPFPHLGLEFEWLKRTTFLLLAA